MGSPSGWTGIAFHSSLPRGQSDCRLEMDPRRLLARLPTGESLAIPFDRMESSRSGADAWAFTSTIPDGPTFTTRDPAAHAAILARAGARTAARRPARPSG